MKIKISKDVIGLFQAVLLLFGPVTARQDVSDMSLADLFNLQVTTASKKSENVKDAPATIYVITKKEIDDRGYVNLNDVLRDLPGMETIDNYFSEIGTQTPIRGIEGNNKIILLINGVRANPAGAEALPIRSDISVRHAYQIEVIYGPGSTLYGQDAISGVINIITQEPGPELEASFAAKGGVNHLEGYGSVLGPITQTNDLGLSVSGFIQYQQAMLDKLSEVHGDHFKTIAEIDGDVIEDRDDIGFNAMARLQTKNNSVQVWHRESKRSSAEGGYAGVLYRNDDAVWRDRTTTVEGKSVFHDSDKLKLETSLTFNRYEIDKSSQYVFPVGNALSDFDFKYGIGTSTILETKALISPIKAFSLVAGATAGNYDVLPKATIDKYPGAPSLKRDLADQAGSFRYITLTENPDTVVYSKVNNVLYRQYGIYLEGEVPFEKGKFIAGLRMDFHSLYEETPISPRLAGIYHPTPALTFKYIFTKAYVAPAPYFGYSTFFSGYSLAKVNTDLGPERATSNEINISYTLERLLVSASGFLNLQDNILVLGENLKPANVVEDSVTAGTTIADGTFINFGNVPLTISANSGSATTYGVDLFSKYYFGSTSTWCSYSWVNRNEGGLSDIDLEKTTITDISRHNVRLGVSHDIISNLTATASFSWRSTPEYPKSAIKDIKAVKLIDEIENPIFVNAYIAYRPMEIVKVFLDAKNILNRKIALDGLLSPTPQEGIKVTGGVQVSF